MTSNTVSRTMESLSNLVTFDGALGNYSVGLHIAVCMKDVLLAFGCAVLVFTFPGYFFFMGRAFWRAFTWGTSQGVES